MESKEIIRKTLALIALVAVAAVVLLLTPESMRLVAALIALPIETLFLSSLIGGSSRRVPQP
jgi:hypothetical protein